MASQRLSPLAWTPLLLALPFIGLPSVGTAQAPMPPEGDIPFEEHYLANGLHVILARGPAATAVAVDVWYDVGSRNERQGRSGFGHLFEHLMFQGSANVRAGEHMQLVERAGGTLNANITEDRTIFYETVPPERMNLALWLEADRMRSLDITEENLRREVEVVKEERRLNFDNAPYGGTQLQALYDAPYDSASCFAYAHSVIGSFADLDAAELSDVQAFFDRYYSPNNATLTVVGAFDPEVALELVQSYFGDIPRGPDAAPVECSRPFGHLPVVMDVPDANAVLPAAYLSYGTVPTDHEDAPALDVLSRILTDGMSSRLYRRLVREERAAIRTGGYSNTRRGPGLFVLTAVARQGVTADRLVDLLHGEVERVIREGVTEEEVIRARSQVQADVMQSRQTVWGRAEALQVANHFHGTPADVRRTVQRILDVTAEEVREVAERYLTPDNRAVVRTVPGAARGPVP